MDDIIAYRPIRPWESESVVTLFRNTFAQDYVERTVYVSNGIGKYLSNLVTFPKLQTDHLILGAWDANSLIGYFHARDLSSVWHLNYIAVLPTYQGTGIGKVLFSQWIDSGKRRGCTTLSLDVDVQNQRARDWYSRLGFEVSDTSVIYRKSRNDKRQDIDDEVCIHEWEAAEAWQSLYGFSQFSLSSKGHRWIIGRLGGKAYRTSEFLPLSVEHSLWMIEPRNYLYVFSDSPSILPDYLEIAQVYRMVRSVK